MFFKINCGGAIFFSNFFRFEIAPNGNINSDEIIKIIESRLEQVFIFSGYGGVLLEDRILDTGKKFLHVHGGYLPDYKGSTTNYYSLIDENTIGASAIFLTKEIDCGPILLRKKFLPPKSLNYQLIFLINLVNKWLNTVWFSNKL